MRLLRVTVLISVALTMFIVNPSFGYEWEKTFSGEVGDNGNSVQQTTDGGYIIAGTPLIKTDAEGNLIWAKALLPSTSSSVRQTPDGGYIIAGTDASTSSSNSRACVIKTNAFGLKLWSWTDLEEEGSGAVFNLGLGGSGDSVQPTIDGGYVMVGAAVSVEIITIALMVKLDSEGNLIWRKTFKIGSLDVCEGRSVQQTKDGGYIVVGFAYTYPGMSPPATAFVIKTDENGNEVWRRLYEPTNAEAIFGYGAIANAVCEATDGGYIIAGGRGEDGGFWLFRLDVDGNDVWSRLLEGWMASSVQQTTDGGYIIAGDTFNQNEDAYNAYLVKTDVDGNELWSKAFSRGYEDYAYSAQETTDGGYIMAGRSITKESSGFDVYLVYYKPDPESANPESTTVVAGTSGGGGGGGG